MSRESARQREAQVQTHGQPSASTHIECTPCGRRANARQVALGKGETAHRVAPNSARTSPGRTLPPRRCAACSATRETNQGAREDEPKCHWCCRPRLAKRRRSVQLARNAQATCPDWCPGKRRAAAHMSVTKRCTYMRPDLAVVPFLCLIYYRDCATAAIMQRSCAVRTVACEFGESRSSASGRGLKRTRRHRCSARSAGGPGAAPSRAPAGHPTTMCDIRIEVRARR